MKSKNYICVYSFKWILSFWLVHCKRLSVVVRLLFLLTVCCLCACTLYAQALSTPCPSIMQGFQSGKGKRPATTKASSGSSASNFSCNNESCKHKTNVKIIAILNDNVHKNYLMPAKTYFYPVLDEPKLLFPHYKQYIAHVYVQNITHHTRSQKHSDILAFCQVHLWWEKRKDINKRTAFYSNVILSKINHLKQTNKAFGFPEVLHVTLIWG